MSEEEAPKAGLPPTIDSKEGNKMSSAQTHRHNLHYSPPQSKGIRPTTSSVTQQPRCPITKRLIAPGDGQHIVATNPDTKATKSFYIHNHYSSPFAPPLYVVRWLAGQGLQPLEAIQ